MERQGQSMFAGVTSAVPNVVMALAVPIYYLVAAKAVFRPHLEVLVA